jgi:Protein of unknown function (DUF3040)
MTLTKKQRRALAELEQALVEQDPAFAEQFDCWRPATPQAHSWGIGGVLAWFGWRRN